MLLYDPRPTLKKKKFFDAVDSLIAARHVSINQRMHVIVSHDLRIFKHELSVSLCMTCYFFTTLNVLKYLFVAALRTRTLDPLHQPPLTSSCSKHLAEM
jgi:hypothetical protein